MKWEQIRKRGKTNYIIKYGVLFWGGFTGISVGLATSYQYFPRDLTSFFISIFTSLLVFMISGSLFGLLMWKLGEQKYLSK